jgi:hypothetical protein
VEPEGRKKSQERGEASFALDFFDYFLHQGKK